MSDGLNKNGTITFGWVERLSVAASVLLMAGAGLDGTHFRPPPDASAYHLRVKTAATALPLTIGDWVGIEVKPDDSAVRLLHPNVMISRSYHNGGTDSSAAFLFVDCQDARDTVGHYPPICYPSQGWSLQGTVPTDWKLSDMTVHGTEYTFVRGVFDGNGSRIVDNFFVLPGEGTLPDREEVIKAAGDLQRRFYGVAQIQLVFSGDSTEAQRQTAFTDLIGPMQELMRTVETVKPVNGVANGMAKNAAGDGGKGELQ